MASNNQTIVVLGVTGNQGRGVARAILNEPALSSFNVVGITRNPSSPSSVRLLSDLQTSNNRLSLATADVFDVKTLETVFLGAYGLFAVTNEWKAGTRCETEEDLKAELTSGQNIVAAAKKTGVKHMIFSSLPNISKASNGRFTKVCHFDHKAEIQDLAFRELPGATALLPAYFYTNFNWTRYCRRKEDGTVRFCPPVSAEAWADWLDPEVDVGVFTAAILAKGPELTRNKVYPISSTHVPFGDLPKIFTSVTGQPAVYEPTTLEEWKQSAVEAVGKGFEEDIGQMMEWTNVSPRDKICIGCVDPKEDKSWEELGVKATGFREWIEKGWKGPAEIDG